MSSSSNGPQHETNYGRLEDNDDGADRPQPQTQAAADANTGTSTAPMNLQLSTNTANMEYARFEDSPSNLNLSKSSVMSSSTNDGDDRPRPPQAAADTNTGTSTPARNPRVGTNTTSMEYARFEDFEGNAETPIRRGGKGSSSAANANAGTNAATRLKGVVQQRIQFRKRRRYYEEAFQRHTGYAYPKRQLHHHQREDNDGNRVQYETVSYELTDTAAWNDRKTALQSNSVYDLSIPCCPGQDFSAACCIDTTDYLNNGDDDDSLDGGYSTGNSIKTNGSQKDGQQPPLTMAAAAAADAAEQLKRRQFGRSNLRNMKFLSRLSLVGIGVAVAAFGFVVNVASESLLDVKLRYALGERAHETLVDWDAFWKWVIPSILAALLATVPVAIRPVAAGSGIAEAKAVLNGIHVFQCTELSTAVCKATSVVLATVASLPCGLEGPLIFIGLAVGENWARIIPRAYPKLRSWRERRDFAAVGSATGVAAAFYAPVGGAIFAAEEGASHLSTRLMWRCFSAACVTVIVEYLFRSSFDGTFLYGRAIYNLSKFNGLPGQFTYRSTPSFAFLELFTFAGMGIANGVIGAVFVELNKRVNDLRRKYIRTWSVKLVEVFILAVISSVLMFLLPVVPAFASCRNLDNVRAEQMYFHRFNCDEGYYNDLATLLFTPAAGTSINLLFWENKEAFSGISCLVAGLVHLILLIFIFGMSIGMGIFVPMLYIGACFGRAFATVVASANVRTYAIVGSVATVAGVTRILVSLTVIMVQTTGLPYFVSPFMIVCITAKVVGRWCFGGDGIYDEIMKSKSLPFLDEEPPPMVSVSVLKAGDIMCPLPLVLMQPEMKVGDLIQTLKSSSHGDFPVVDPARNNALIGSIPRERLIHLLYHKEQFRDSEESDGEYSNLTLSAPIVLDDDLFVHGHLMPTLEAVERKIMEDGSKDMVISIARQVQLSPYTFNEDGSAERAYELFRTLGLRNLIVTDLEARPVGIITRDDLKILEKIDKVERGCRGQETAVNEPPSPVGPIV